MFNPSLLGKWIISKKTSKVRQPGPVYQYRLAGGFIELGQRSLRTPGKAAFEFEPWLKIGARIGETWRYTGGDNRHIYSLEKFDEHQGRPSLLVKEMVIKNSDPDHSTEITHLYVRDVGEVERREVRYLTSTERAKVGERRLVEEDLIPKINVPKVVAPPPSSSGKADAASASAGPGARWENKRGRECFHKKTPDPNGTRPSSLWRGLGPSANPISAL